MEYALIFAIMAGQPTVLEYYGNLSAPYDLSRAQVISLDEAERILLKRTIPRTPILVAYPGKAVYGATQQDGLDLLAEWIEAQGDRDQMKKSLYRTYQQLRQRSRNKLLIP